MRNLFFSMEMSGILRFQSTQRAGVSGESVRLDTAMTLRRWRCRRSEIATPLPVVPNATGEPRRGNGPVATKAQDDGSGTDE